MKSLSRKQWLLLAVLGLLFLVIRFFALLEKPLHHDESINAWFVMQMWHQGFFRYDPSNYHGPLLFYLVQLSEVLFGDGLWSLRVVPNFFSWLTVVFFLWRGLTGNKLWLIAAAVVGFSPAFEFFGRSGIHESILVFCYLMALWALERAFDQVDKFEIFLFIGALAAAATVKETVVVFVISIGLPIIIFRQWKLSLFVEKKRWWMISIFAALIFIFALFTGFFQNAQGAADFFIAYLPWFKTGVHGNGHEKSVLYWFELMLQNEIPSFLLALGGLISWRWVSKKTRFFLVIAWVHFVIYSLIPYKTPWCLISILLPLVYAGSLALMDIELRRPRFFWPAVVLSVLIPLPTFWQISYQHPLKLNHPYVYVQTQYSFQRVIQYLELNRDLIGQREILVATAEFWPLPWWLRNFKLGFRSSAVPETGLEIIIVDASNLATWKEKLGAEYFYHEFQTRDSREPAVLILGKQLQARMTGEL